jgi:hypothetical protein
LQIEIFEEDYRHKELCGEQQKNMDSTFESVYHSAQQHLLSPIMFTEYFVKLKLCKIKILSQMAKLYI